MFSRVDHISPKVNNAALTVNYGLAKMETI